MSASTRLLIAVRRVGAAVVIVLAVLASASGLVTPAAAAPVTSQGYVPMPDGTQLHYTLTVPDATGKFPTLFTYDNYSAGSSTPNSSPSPYVADGYAVIGVNLPGTGCSTGYGNWADVSTWGRDGAEVVEWIARQTWSNGRVGMFGASFPGMTQVGVAGFDPPHLDAIAPWSVTTDAYRDTSYPGGIYNIVWMDSYGGAVEPALTGPAIAAGAAQADTSCGALNPSSAPNNVVADPEGNASLAIAQHPFYDAYWADSIEARVHNIHIPVYGCLTWEDGAVFSRSTEIYLMELPKATTWYEGNNGGHTACVLPGGSQSELAFFDHFVKGIDNGFQKTPHIIIQHEVNGSTPAWTSYIDDWSSTVQPTRLYLHGRGLLNTTPPAGTDAADTYSYPTPSPSDSAWQYTYDAPNGSVSYTTPPLSGDADFFGPGSLDLWLSATTTDTDLQATVSEIRPDGQEQYISRGWLRMSHRALDPAKSTALRPFHTDTAADNAPLIPGQATFARLELWPFEHLFRKGSSIRITIDTPAANQYTLSGFDFLANPSTNSVYHDPWHVSSVVLPLIPGAVAGAPLPACGNVTSQPCRTNMTPVPSGSLAIR